MVLDKNARSVLSSPHDLLLREFQVPLAVLATPTAVGWQQQQCWSDRAAAARVNLKQWAHLVLKE